MVLDVVTPTIADVFTTAGSVMTGGTQMALDFFNTLWTNPIGQISIGAGILGIGFMIWRHIRKGR